MIPSKQFFEHFRNASVERCSYFGDGAKAGSCMGWTLTKWRLAALGEMGEVLNALKKIELGGGSARDVADEISDVFTYIDLFAAAQHISTDAIYDSLSSRCRGGALTFELKGLQANIQQDNHTLFTAAGIQIERCMKRMATASYSEDISQMIYWLLVAMALLGDLDFTMMVEQKFNEVSKRVGFPKLLMTVEMPIFLPGGAA